MNQPSDRDKISARIHRQGMRPADANLLGSAQIRSMLGWVIALGLLTVVVNLPIYPESGRIGWRNAQPTDEFKILPLPPTQKTVNQAGGTPVTVFVQPEEDKTPVVIDKEEKEEKEEEKEDPRRRIQKLERIDRGRILEFVDESPAIIGGLSTLYLNIDYPKSARDQGIEGLTVLMFVVETDGSTSDVTIIKPLHPALDSSAVSAVRNTLFKPGRQDGKIVRVKMRLPIRFRLVKPNEQNTPTMDSVAVRLDS